MGLGGTVQGQGQGQGKKHKRVRESVLAIRSGLGAMACGHTYHQAHVLSAGFGEFHQQHLHASESSIRNNSMSKGTGKTGNQANDEDPYSAFAREMDDLARSESAKGKGKKGKGKKGKIAEEPDDSSD